MYKVQATSGHSSTREEMFTNLNQVYGFLVGVIAAYRQHPGRRGISVSARWRSLVSN